VAARLEVDGWRARLSLDRPEARNALSVELLSDLHARLDEIDASVRVLVLTGEGPVFCAGMDLKQVIDDEKAPAVLLRSLAELCMRLRGLGCVVVARVNGAAIVGGCGLSCACDFSVTHAEAKLGFPDVDLGLCPAVVAPWVVRRVGAGMARRVLLSGGLMSGEEAGRIGLASHVAPSAEGLDDGVDELVERIGTGGAEALRATKGMLNRLDGSLDEALARESAAISAGILGLDESRRTLRERFGRA
jgi:enoyl-CoA hydratase/carnithine racemase